MKHTDWLALGYDSIVPIAPPMSGGPDAGKVPGRYDAATGRWYGFSGWSRARPTPAEAKEWEAWGAGVGLVNADGRFFILDIDSYDEATGDAIERKARAMLGDAPRRVGEWPKRALLYRAAEPLPKVNLPYGEPAEGQKQDRIETTPVNGQIVVEGTHPKTGKPYQWDRDVPRVEDLPLVTGEQVRAFFDLMAAKLPKAKLKITSAHQGPAKSPAELMGDPELIRQAVEATPNPRDLGYEAYIAMGQAIRGAFGPGLEEDAFDCWHEWVQRWEGGPSDSDLVRKHWNTMTPSRTLGADYVLSRSAPEFNAMRFFAPVVTSPVDDMFDAMQPQPETALAPLRAGRLSLDNLSNLPPREWLYGRKILRRYVTFVAAAGGVGKTAFMTAVTLACASGLALLHDQPVRPLRVWVLNLEDDLTELHRRMAAAFHHYGLGAEVLDNIRVNSGRDRRFVIVRQGRDGDYHIQPDYEAVIAEMKREQIDLLIVDPFLRSHRVSENDNEAQDEVMRLYAQIAHETGAGVVLIHHVKKGAIAGDMDGLRGGSTQGGGARSVLTLAPMTPEEAKAAGIDEKVRRLYVRIDDAKNNMAPPMARAEWLRLTSVSLGNFTDDYPMGDEVQVATKYVLPGAWDGADVQFEVEALEHIARGMPDGERYSDRPQDGERWAGTMLMEKFGRSKAQASEILAGWKKAGRVGVEDYLSPKQRKTRKGMVTYGGFPADSAAIFE